MVHYVWEMAFRLQMDLGLTRSYSIVGCHLHGILSAALGAKGSTTLSCCLRLLSNPAFVDCFLEQRLARLIIPQRPPSL
jgi:hypothetical protein